MPRLTRPERITRPVVVSAGRAEVDYAKHRGQPVACPERSQEALAIAVWLSLIPQRSDQLAQHRGRPLAFDKETYRGRSVIECCIGWLKECRRLATRFEKLALYYLAMV
jgi:transposase